MITSRGYNDDSISAPEWAESLPRLGSAHFGVAHQSAWVVSPAPGDRTIQVGPGIGFGSGVWDDSDSAVPLTLSPVPTGDRWDLICMSRVWAGSGLSTFSKVEGTAVRALPNSRKKSPGVEEDQPVALARLRAGSTLIQEIIDLRVVVGDGGGMVASDELVLTYLDAVGTTIRIGSTVWTRALDVMGTPVWVRQDITQASAPISSAAAHWGFTWPGYAPGAVQRSGDRVHMRGLLSNTGVVSVAPSGHYKVGTIPSEFAPSQQAAFPTLTGTGTGPSTLSVFPNGDIYLDTYYAASGFSTGFFICWLDGFSWPAKV